MTEQKKSRYLEYLPAIYHEDPFLGEFLLPFEKVLTGFEELLSNIDCYFAPALTDTDFLPWLANWVALVLDEDWEEPKRRHLIGEAVELYRWRGTVRGLKRYLEIYTGLVPEIRECCWPGGMQIGVASRIGCTIPEDASLTIINRATRKEPVTYYDYYIVDTITPADHPEVPTGCALQLYYRADRVKEVTIRDGCVEIRMLDDHTVSHEKASVTRRDGLIDDHYTLETGTGARVEYTGDTILVDEEDLPYRFIVEVRVPAEEIKHGEIKKVMEKVRAIVDLEKPAHTLYYLKLTPVVSEYLLQPMQIGILSRIGIDTIIG